LEPNLQAIAQNNTFNAGITFIYIFVVKIPKFYYTFCLESLQNIWPTVATDTPEEALKKWHRI